MVAHARAHSPYYRELYQGLPERVDDPALLPVTDKKALMARFDDWVTDREITLERVQEFVADPARAGEAFQGRYMVATTSGTSGVRGLFVLDERCMAVHTALGSRAGGGLGPRDLRAPGVERFQIVQTAPTTLPVRLRAGDGDGADAVWRTVRREIAHLLAEHKAGDVTLERAEEPPQQSPGGKLRRIIPLTRP
ncbi:hypothetical protein [Nonomuraea sp. NPDC050691]|uniref:hypothetical protein n=1 Tax=Nonomuraea sp. NPDC050691 TaxID=3155661 RepID=UPI0033D29DBA